nr:hypothetical protein 1 [Mute swan feces associated picorna-like virus 16]
MTCSNNDQKCGSAPFQLTKESSVELNDYLMKDHKYSGHTWIELPKLVVCSRVPDCLSLYLERERDFLTDIFEGRAFATTYDSCLDTLLQCDPMPQVIMLPKISIYGNRIFMCEIDSEWYKFLLPYCSLFDGNELKDVWVRSITSLPPHILDRIKVKAQGLFDISFVKVDAEELVKSLFGHIDAIMNHTFFQTAKMSAKAFGILLQLTSVISNPTAINVSSLLYNLFISCSVPFILIQRAVTLLAPYYDQLVKYLTTPRAQNFVNDIDFGPICRTLVVTCATVLSLIVGSKLPEKGMLTAALRFAGTFGRSIVGITTLAAFLTTHTMTIFDWAYERIVGVPRDLSSLETFEKEVETFIHRVNKVLKEHGDSMVNLRDKPNEIRYLLDTRTMGCNIHERLIRSKCSVAGMRVFDRYFQKLEKIVEKAELYGGHGSGPRPEPLVIQIFGGSGCGKSHVPYFIAADLCIWEQAEGSPVEHMYYRKTTNEYFDGYKPGKHLMCVYDDFGQGKDSQTKPNEEFMEMIYACNIAEWPLHMATLQEKACTYFNSKMVLLTSNHVRYNIQSMTEPEAFVRRVDLRFEISIDPKYMNAHGGIDAEKVKSLHPGVDGVSEHVYRFVPYMRTTGKGNDAQFAPMQYAANFEPVVLTYDQMIKYVKLQYEQKLGHSQQRINAMEKRYKKLKDEAEAAEFVDAHPPKAQVSLSQVDEMLICWWARQGFPFDLYVMSDNNHETILEVDRIRLQSDSVWEFVDQVLINRCPLVPKMMSSAEQKIDNVVENVTRSMHDVVYGEEFATASEAMEAKSIIDSIKEYVSGLSKVIVENLKYIIGIVTAALAMYKVYSWISRSDKVLAEGNVSGDAVTKSRPVVRVEHCVSGDVKTNAKPVVRVEHEVSGDAKTMSKPTIRVENALPNSEAYIDCNAQEILSNNITTNTYRIGGRDQKFSANILFIQGRTAICNWHVWDFLKQFKIIKIANNDLMSGYEVPYDSIEMHEMTLRGDDSAFKDVVMIRFPKSIHQHKDISKHFVRGQDIAKFNKVKGILAGYVPHRQQMLYRVEPLLEIKARDTLRYEYTQPSTNEIVELKIRRAYHYHSQTGAGDCGSALLINSPTIPRKICGIHVAGDVGYGYATSVTADDIERCLLKFEDEVKDYILPNVVDSAIPLAQVRNEMPEGEFVPLGICSEPAGSPGKSDIRTSPIYEQVEGHKSLHLPAALKPIIVDGERVDPMKKGLKKCGVPTTWIDPDLLEMAKNDFRSVLFTNTNENYRKVLTYEEAIMGTSDEFMSPMNRRSSPGYGWTTKAGKSIGKTKWLGSDEYILDNAELRESVERREILAKQGVRAPHLWVDTLKVERRTIEKVLAGKTRVFSVGQMDYGLLSRKYFLGFNGHVMNNRIDNEIAVGVNPYSIEWTQLANHLRKKGDCVIAGDFSNYDGTLNPQIMHACLDLINEWYDDGEENFLIRRTLFEEVVSSIHICGKLVYQWTHSQPSGNPLTTILNSMYNSVSMRVVYALEFGEIKSFRDNVSMISYGDDNVVNIKRQIIDRFNQYSISARYSEIGMTYTDESKGKNELVKSRALSEVEFLKRGFIERNGRFDAPLSLDTILEMVYWVRGELDHDELCISNCENAYLELSLHSPEVFELWTQRIAKACRKQNLYPTLHTYEIFRRMLFLGCIGSNRGTVVNEDECQLQN